MNTVEPAGPAIVNATFVGTRADDLLLLLDEAGIEASTGSACSAGVDAFSAATAGVEGFTASAARVEDFSASAAGVEDVSASAAGVFTTP